VGQRRGHRYSCLALRDHLSLDDRAHKSRIYRARSHRDAKFSAAFRQILRRENIAAVRLPARSPNLSPHIERFMKSIKEECLLRMIFFGQRSLENAVGQYLLHYHGERNHQALANKIIEPAPEVGRSEGEIQGRERLGGLLRYYHRDAA
jgi:putative transposase